MIVTDGELRLEAWGRCLARVAEGDREALAQLYDQTSASLLRQAMAITRNREDAEEVLLELYTQVWRRARDFDPRRGTAGAWLTTLVRSRAIDHVRRRSRRQLRERPLTDVSAAPEPGGGPEERVAQSERRTHLQRAMETLPPPQRRAIELAFFSGLSHSEVARKLGEPLGTVKTRIRQGLGRLRGRIDPGLAAQVSL